MTRADPETATRLTADPRTADPRTTAVTRTRTPNAGEGLGTGEGLA